MRAARHYEGAEQILIRQAVMSACRFISVGQEEPPPIGHWVLVECPARIDVSGEHLWAGAPFAGPSSKGFLFWPGHHWGSP